MSDTFTPAEVQKTREKYDKTRADLASAIGCSEKTVERLETGKTPQDRRTYLALKMVFSEWQQSGSKRSRRPQ